MPEGDFDFYYGSAYAYFVPARVKQLFEEVRLLGVQFRTTYYAPIDMTVEDTDRTVQIRHGIPYWEIDSDLVMPLLSPSMKLVDLEGQLVPRGRDVPCSPRDGMFLHPELHYRASDLAKLPPFDVARVQERFQGHGSPGDRPLIVTKRFYEFCIGRGLRGGWVPVRIES